MTGALRRCSRLKTGCRTRLDFQSGSDCYFSLQLGHQRRRRERLDSVCRSQQLLHAADHGCRSPPGEDPRLRARRSSDEASPGRRGFNISNHENVTSVQTSAYTLSANSNVTSGCSGSQSQVPGQAQEECSTMTFVPLVGSGHLASGFKAITNTNSDYVYTPRQVQLALRLDF